ncbi:hypothetical protein FA95DRAFT_1608817 [Auriscalpium vulgare]|uniref:Uncharacterized protein n=1 Tax=Auriscalpium vulgare TaxID=40419 RepID=A0ACB8RIR8_9AGAM|nr:hypothetical protein FA95DRAFT_1608817 [Auriscalpium vulgare]
MSTRIFPSTDGVLAPRENRTTVENPLPPLPRAPQNKTSALQHPRVRREKSADHIRTVEYDHFTCPQKPQMPVQPEVEYMQPLPSSAFTPDDPADRHQCTAESFIIPKIVIEDWDHVEYKADASWSSAETNITSKEANSGVTRRRCKVISQRFFAFIDGIRISMRRVKSVQQIERDLSFDLLN